MTDRDNDDLSPGYASPPCFMHELDPAYAGLPEADPQASADVRRWRKAERERLIAERLALPVEVRRDYGQRIGAALEALIGDPSGMTVSTYWPFRGEPDLRPMMERLVARGGKGALPVVVKHGQPLVFRLWSPGDPLERGVWNIPFPAQGAEVLPDVVIAPVVGYDRACYRLGYGGGFFDRTLAAMPRKPRIYGVGYSLTAMATIHPQPHDIPMDAIVTEKGVVTPEPG